MKECVIDGKYNLICGLGHRWYAPKDREEREGRICGYPADKGYNRCPYLLHLYDDGIPLPLNTGVVIVNAYGKIVSP
jgi:hypothetical protein